MFGLGFECLVGLASLPLAPLSLALLACAVAVFFTGRIGCCRRTIDQARMNVRQVELDVGNLQFHLGLTLDAGHCLAVALDARAPLGNSGGTITLLDAAGRTAHGVSYSRAHI